MPAHANKFLESDHEAWRNSAERARLYQCRLKMSDSERLRDDGCIEHIDGPLLLANTGGDPDLMRELLAIFVRTFAIDIEQLNNAVQVHDISKIHHLLHRTKGSLQILGARSTVDLIRQISASLDDEIKVQQLQALQQLLQRFDEILREAIAFYEPQRAAARGSQSD